MPKNEQYVLQFAIHFHCKYDTKICYIYVSFFRLWHYCSSANTVQYGFSRCAKVMLLISFYYYLCLVARSYIDRCALNFLF